MWREITRQVSSLGVCPRTEAEVKNKWRNLSRGAKDEFTQANKERRKTGGGPAPVQPSQAEENIINSMKETACFRGVSGGLESRVVMTIEEEVEEGEGAGEGDREENLEDRQEAMEAVWRECLEAHFDRLGDAQTVPLCSTPINQQEKRRRPSEENGKAVKKQKTTVDDVYNLQMKVLERELVKTNLQIQLLERLHSKLDDNLLSGMLSCLGQ